MGKCVGFRGRLLLGAALVAAAGVLSACDDGAPAQDGGADGTTGDLPAAPVYAGTLAAAPPAGLADSFTRDGDGGGPCLTEPSLDAMVPRNFNPLRFEWIAPAGDNVFELRVHADGQAHDLVVYTDATSYTMDQSVWRGLSMHEAGHDLVVTIRSGHWEAGALTAGPHLGSQGAVHIAPVDAPGVVMYWTTTGGSAIKAFHVGDGAATPILTPSLMHDDTQCIGCHVSSPDGKYTFVGRSSNPGGGPFGVDVRRVDGTGARASTSDVSSAALSQLLREVQVMPTLSQAHWSSSDAVAISLLGGSSQPYQLIWTDLHVGTTGVMERTGDPGQPDTPSFSHDGSTIAYASTRRGRIAMYVEPATTDIYTVPFGRRQGGTAKPLPGASDPSFNEYYPVYSPYDTLIAFNRIGAGRTVYNAEDAEVYVIPSRGGTPVRVTANDPPACSGVVSPGITNSWPRWAPATERVGSQHYYWLVFSSRRRPSPTTGAQRLPQLFISAVVTRDDENGREVLDRTYPAVYITTQSPAEANHTPAWDYFQIPPPG